MHLSAGLEVLTQHRFTLHVHNPPFPRVLTALPPWLAGARFEGSGDLIEEMKVKFYSTGHYKTMLALARAPTLFFFLLGALATWAWARRETDDTTALLALFFFTTQPAILGHSGLATVDTAATAGMAVALFAFSRWLTRPDWIRAAILGAAWGFSINCKLLCIAYVPLACAAIYIVRMLRDAQTRAQWRKIVTVLAVPPVAVAVVWIGYGFSLHQFITGVTDMMAVNEAMYEGYAFGQWRAGGWWWYFPLTVALKTTLATLLITIAGFFLVRKNGVFLETIAAAAAVLALSMTTHVDVGLRYVLPIYVPLSIAMAIAALAMIRHRQKLLRVAAMLLLSWHFIASTIAHPDYLAYFNEIALPDPSRYLVDSNLDWGQDILRLRNEVRRRKIDHLGVSLFGPADLTRLGFPPHNYVDSETPTQGWIAVSDSAYRWGTPYGGWRWLDRKKCDRIGKSIRLCYVE